MNTLTHLVKDHCTITEQGCWEWQGTRRKGYGRLTIERKGYSVHRLVFADSVAKIAEGNVVMHAVCDNPPCCNPDHLKQGTQAENMADMQAKGRKGVWVPPEGYVRKVHTPSEHVAPQGEKHANSKMTDAVVKEMRYLYSSGQMNQRQLSEKFGVSQSNISRALSGRQWGHV